MLAALKSERWQPWAPEGLEWSTDFTELIPVSAAEADEEKSVIKCRHRSIASGAGRMLYNKYLAHLQ